MGSGEIELGQWMNDSDSLILFSVLLGLLSVFFFCFSLVGCFLLFDANVNLFALLESRVETKKKNIISFSLIQFVKGSFSLKNYALMHAFVK